ncbi:AAA family ATPase [Sphingobacterium shayense]|nr:AAA family ATPase [Sphingobacterium shayense]
MNILDLLINQKEHVLLADVYLSVQNRVLVEHLIKERKHIDLLHGYGLPVNNKVLLNGSSGCGKTTTAKAIANALGKPLYILNLSNIVSARIGETAQNLKLVFDRAARDSAVLFLDEFDQIAKARGYADTDVGEMRRLVNSLIQLIDFFPEKGLLICATNHLEVIDAALQRRFQVNMKYELPTETQLNQYYDSILSKFPESITEIERLYKLSYAQAKDSAYNQLKIKLLAQVDE